MSTEIASKVKALITAKGGTVTEAEDLSPFEIKQFAEIAHLYYGVLPALSLIGLTYPDNLPAQLKEALDVGSEEEAVSEGDEPDASINAEFAPAGEEGDEGDDLGGDAIVGSDVGDTGTEEAGAEDLNTAEDEDPALEPPAEAEVLVDEEVPTEEDPAA